MDLEFDNWIRYGYEKGWVSDVFCNTHEGPPLTDQDELDWEEGGDPCSFHVRVWELE